MVTLPPLRPAALKSFWLVISIGLGLLSAFCIIRPVSIWSFSIGAIVAAVLTFAGTHWPRIVHKPYRLYNVIACQISRYGSLIVMGICFYIVLVAVGRKESTLTLARPLALQSLWVSRQPLARDAYKNQHPIVTNNPPSQSWITAFCSWAVRSGNVWACGLLPLLVLLSLFSDEQDNAVPADLYTLF
jgi:hypothetical protein